MKYLIPLLLCIFIASPVSTLDREETIGREDNWKGILFSSGVKKETGRQGFTDILLADGEYRGTPDTDLLLHFNRTPFADAVGNYRIVEENLEYTRKEQVFGDGAGVFRRNTSLMLVPGESSLFARGRTWNDFTLEFWLYPAAMENGEILLLWKGAEQGTDGILPQEIRCSVLDRKLVWDFSNFFSDFTDRQKTVTLSGTKPLIPREWNHHLIRFDSSTGLLEYLINGSPEGVTYASRSGNEDGTVYLPRIGSYSNEPVEVGPLFTGFIDELRISSRFVEEPSLDRYSGTDGTIMTGILDLGYSGTRLKSIEAVYSAPSDSAAYFYYYLSETSASPLPDDPGWKIFEPGERLPENARGRFLSLMVRLFPDGREQRSPVVSEMTITYEPDYPPQEVAELMAEPGDGSVTLTWSRVTDGDLAGYLVYYGTRPGEYFGSGSSGGASPIDAGNRTEMTISGLTNGGLYYFSVVAYDSSEPPHTSGFSREVSSRPSVLEGTE